MKAFITGINGQDGSYLAEYLIAKNYEVHGTIRRTSSINTKKIDHLISTHQGKNLYLYYSDLLDSSSLTNLISKIEPNEIYNLAAQSHVAVSFQNPLFTTETSTVGPLSLLESIRNVNKEIKFYQASSSEMYGGSVREALDENSKFDPKSPYAAAKVFAFEISKIYRESYDMFATNGILFNHESPRRGETFVTRKISKAVGRIHVGIQNKLTLGNLNSYRDWGFAGDYVKAMWQIMQYEKPEDWVIATGETYSVNEFVKEAFSLINLDSDSFIETSEKYFRPNEVDYLLGNPTKASKKLGWKPETSFKELVKMMVEHDINEAKKEYTLLKENLISPTWESPVSPN
tara:strand:+ start:2793 stop:3827 length:1035 start_codon:yes stop_codon:yes gene_type:complete